MAYGAETVKKCASWNSKKKLHDVVKAMFHDKGSHQFLDNWLRKIATQEKCKLHVQ